jgi:hypothetical protein
MLKTVRIFLAFFVGTALLRTGCADRCVFVHGVQTLLPKLCGFAKLCYIVGMLEHQVPRTIARQLNS